MGEGTRSADGAGGGGDAGHVAPAGLRVLHPDDWEVWRRLRRAALAEAPGAFGSVLAEWSGSGDTEARWRRRLADVPYNIVAEAGGEAVGMGSCTSVVDGTAELVSLWVAPEARGRGVGALLVDAVARHAAAHGADQLVLGVRESNLPARALYARCGFADNGPCPDCPDGPHAERRMARPLP